MSRSGQPAAAAPTAQAAPDPAPTRPAGTSRRGERPHPSGDDRFALVDKALLRARYAQDQLIEVLHVAQDIFGFLSPDVLHYLARELRLPPSAVFGVATFYHLFSFDPPGDHAATVCTGTACFVKGADEIVAGLRSAYGVDVGQTAADGSFTLFTARCLGSCGMAPVVVVDGEVRGHQQPASALDAVATAIASANPSAPGAT